MAFMTHTCRKCGEFYDNNEPRMPIACKCGSNDFRSVCDETFGESDDLDYGMDEGDEE